MQINSPKRVLKRVSIISNMHKVLKEKGTAMQNNIPCNKYIITKINC